MMCIDYNVIICTAAATEVEALRKALCEAEEKAIQQQAARKKLKARVKEVQQELQDAVKKCETLENNASAHEAELTKARQSAETARNETHVALQEIQEAKKITAGKEFKMQSKYAEKRYLLLTRIYHAVYQRSRSSTKPKEGVLRRSYSGRNILCQSIRCPLAIS